MKKIAALLTAAMLFTLLAVPASALDFVLSGEQNPAPPVETVTDSEGNEVIAIIEDEEGDEVHGVETGELIVTATSEREEAEETIQNMLENALEQVRNAESVADLTPGIGDFLTSIGSPSQVSDLTVRDLFDVTVTGTAAEYLAVPGNTITVRFELNLAASSTLVVLHNYSGSNWEIIPDNRVVRNANGSVDVTFDSLSPVAFVVDGTELSTDVPDEVDVPRSPQTGDSGLPVAGVSLMVLGFAALAAVAVFWKKRA